MLLIDKVVVDLGDIANSQQIRPFDLKELGYVLSGRKIPVASPGVKAQHHIMEVLDEDTKRPPHFCFLYSKQAGAGMILNDWYDSYDGIKDVIPKTAEEKKSL